MSSQTDISVGSALLRIWNEWKRFSLIGVVAVLVCFLVYKSGYIIGTVLAAIVFSYIALPIVDGLCKTPTGRLRGKTQRLVATIVVFLLLIGVAWLMVQMMVVPFAQEIHEFKGNAKSYTTTFKSYFGEVTSWYSEFVPQQVQDAIKQLDYTMVWNRVTTAAERVLTFVGSWIQVALDVIIIPVFAFYFVFDYRKISKEFYGLFPRRRWREALRLGRRVGEITQSYVVGQLILCLIAGSFTTAFLAILGMPYVVVLGLFAGITRAIPIIGPIVSGVPIILVGILNSSGPAVPIALLIFVIVVHFAESKFIMPRLIGTRLHLHPAIVLAVLLVGAEFFGLIGMFVAAPIAAIVRDVFRFYYIGDRGGGSRPHPVGE